MTTLRLVRWMAVCAFAAGLGLLLGPVPRVHAKSNPYLVKDINPSSGSAPRNLVNVNGTLFFTADDGVHGEELWKSDGTQKGTVLVKDINPSGSTHFWDFLSADGTLFFRAHDGSHGFELWKSDGTPDGTVMVKDINPSNRYVIYVGSNLANIGGTVFFGTDDGFELWKSDGTPEGTVMFKDINPEGWSWPRNLTNVNGTLFFSANDGVHGGGLWKSDGTERGTVLVQDIAVGYSLFTQANGILFFAAFDELHGQELWRHSGTGRDVATIMVKDFAPGRNWSQFCASATVKRLFYFSRCNGNGRKCALWKTDGTTQGTVLLRNEIDPTSWCDHSLVGVNNKLFFSGWDESHGHELWTSDGTSNGTVMVKDINPAGSGVDKHYSFDPKNVANGKLFFPADDGKHGYELWQSDGTRKGTVMVQDINPSDGSYPEGITNVSGLLFFSAYDGKHGTELWAYKP